MSYLFERLLPLIITDQREEVLARVHRSALDLQGDVATLHLAWVHQRRDGSLLRQTRNVLLPHEARLLLAHALVDGHLQQREADFQTSGIDFPLFPEQLKNHDGVAAAPLCPASPNLLDVDPRIALAVELGGELRVGQVLECTRMALSLDATKRGETIILNARQRASTRRCRSYAGHVPLAVRAPLRS